MILFKNAFFLLALLPSFLHASFPIEAPRAEGYLQVSEKHQLYYATYGNPEGIPVVILHGGPGAGCKDAYTQFFDLKLWHLVMFDQRGAMRSRPFASMEENTPQHSVNDIEALRRHLGIKQWAVFGNSWGSCLAILYGQAYPNACLGFILEGTFLARSQDIGFFSNMGKCSPAAFEQFVSTLSSEERKDIAKACHSRMMDPNPAVQMATAKAIMRLMLLDSMTPPSSDALDKILADDRLILSFIKAIVHYAYNGCFLEPNQLLLNMDKIAHLPATIVHGTSDCVNLPEQAYILHENWKNSSLCMVAGAGHSCFEPAISEALAEATRAFFSIWAGIRSEKTRVVRNLHVLPLIRAKTSFLMRRIFCRFSWLMSFSLGLI